MATHFAGACLSLFCLWLVKVDTLQNPRKVPRSSDSQLKMLSSKGPLEIYNELEYFIQASYSVFCLKIRIRIRILLIVLNNEIVQRKQQKSWRSFALYLFVYYKLIASCQFHRGWNWTKQNLGWLFTCPKLIASVGTYKNPRLLYMLNC